MSDMSGFLTGFSNSLNQYLQVNNQFNAQQQQEVFKNKLANESKIAAEGREQANQKELKLYDMQLGELKEATKWDRETLPISMFQNKGIEEADSMDPSIRVQFKDVVDWFGKKSAGKIQGLDGLRKEYFTQNKDFVNSSQSTQRLMDSAKDPSAAGDLALIFNYMKILDPGSTVREGEFSNAQNSGGIPDRIRAQYNKVLEGERLSQPMRDDFLGRGVELYKGQEKLHKKSRAIFGDTAVKQGIDPSLVALEIPVPDLTSYEENLKKTTEAPKATGGWGYVGPVTK